MTSWSSELTGYSERLKQEASKILWMLRWEFGAQSKSAWICRSWTSAFYWCPEGQSERSEVTANSCIFHSAITPHPFLVFFSTFFVWTKSKQLVFMLDQHLKKQILLLRRKPFFLVYAWQASCKNEENQCQVCLNIQGRAGKVELHT